EIVIDINVDVIATPTAAPSPAAASPEGAHRKAHAPRNRSAGIIARWRIVNGWIRIVRICGTVNHNRIVTGNVNDLRIGLFNYDDLLAFNNFRFDFNLLARL